MTGGQSLVASVLEKNDLCTLQMSIGKQISNLEHKHYKVDLLLPENV